MKEPRQPRVLVVEDEELVAEMLGTALRMSGFETTIATDGYAALAHLEGHVPDLLLLDVGLPGISGFEVCRRLRAVGSTVPVIFLTARDEREDVVKGFAKGGDDYVTKPFGLDELVARMRAVLRRCDPGLLADGARTLRYGDLVLDEDTHEVTRHDAVVDLSPTEFRLLHFLLLNPERVLGREQILDHVWPYDYEGRTSVVDTYVSYLRKKLDSTGPALIQTVRGFGYMLKATS